jgi:hypothetical protein
MVEDFFLLLLRGSDLSYRCRGRHFRFPAPLFETRNPDGLGFFKNLQNVLTICNNLGLARIVRKF